MEKFRDIEATAEAPRYLILPFSPERRRVDLWSSVRLPFEPKDWVREMRDDLRTALMGVPVRDGEVLHALYASSETGVFDLENVLFYNVGSGCFTESSANGVRFERRVGGRIPAGPQPALRHFQSYSPALREADFLYWTTSTVAEWSASLPPLSSSTAVAAVWLAVKSVDVESVEAIREGEPCALRVRLTVPQVSQVSATSILKPLLDGIVSALHAHDGTDCALVAARLTRQLGLHRDDIARLLMDGSSAVLGRRRLLWPRGDGVQWNPADDQVVACELLVERGEGWATSGTLSRATPTP